MILLEAMAAGAPAVASRVGGIPEFAEDAALLVPPEDEEALASALRQVVGDGALRERLAAAGRERAESYEWSSIVDRYEELYHPSS
jgi:glycosyltransferase involved in cell wall biosynthesis